MTARTSSRVSTTGRCRGRLGGGGNLPLNGERGQECGDFRGAHLRRMTLAVEEDVALDPVDIGLLGASAVVAGLDGVADAVEEAGLRRLRRVALLAHPRDAATAASGQRRMVA
jgi:hypothetical protein